MYVERNMKGGASVFALLNVEDYRSGMFLHGTKGFMEKSLKNIINIQIPLKECWEENKQKNQMKKTD